MAKTKQGNTFIYLAAIAAAYFAFSKGALNGINGNMDKSNIEHAKDCIRIAVQKILDRDGNITENDRELFLLRDLYAIDKAAKEAIKRKLV